MMKNIKRLFVVISIVLLAFIGTSCEENCSFTPKPGDYDPSTFDDFANNVFKMLVGNDELTLNYYFENPENFGLSHNEPSLPTPSVTSGYSVLLINYILGKVNGYKYEDLNDDQKMTYNLIMNIIDNVNSKTSEMSYLSNNYLGSYLGYQAQLPLLLSEYKFRTKLDVDNYLKYLDLVPETFQKYLDFEVEKADHGYGMSDFVIDKVVHQCEEFIKAAGTGNHFMIKTVNKKIDECDFLTDEEKEAYKNANIEKVNGPLISGYKLVQDELPKLKGRSTNDMGLAYYYDSKGNPIGKTYYELDFQETVGYKISLVDAEKYVDDLLKYYEQELVKYRNLYLTNEEFKANCDSYQLMDKTPEEQLAYYQTVIGKYFPSLNYQPEIVVKFIDKAMEEHFSPAAYMTSAIDNLEKEYIYLNGSSVLTDGVYKYNYLYTTLAHEGLPGHLYQNVYFKSTDANPLRKVLKSSGYSEGWATYAEIFSYEFLRGEYMDEFIDYLIFQDEYTGAMYCRLDMGINYDGWTLEEAGAFIKKYVPQVTDEAIKATYEQLIEVPNNMQTYFFTYFKIKDLRTYVMNLTSSTRENFDYITFHKYILDCGPAPLRFVEEYVKSKYE